ncbi:hypothetical protein QTP88_008646 [Uroleucon formosanum]
MIEEKKKNVTSLNNRKVYPLYSRTKLSMKLGKNFPNLVRNILSHCGQVRQHYNRPTHLHKIDEKLGSVYTICYFLTENT